MHSPGIVMRGRGLLCLTNVLLIIIVIQKSQCKSPDSCLSNPCHSNEYCISNEDEGFQCKCKQGWTGDDCTVDVDECQFDSINPCEHDGVCINSPGSYQCRCPSGYYGSKCENEVLECSINPCKNGGTCIDLIDGFQCICPLGYEGASCENEVNECSSSPCKNGAQCEDLINSYTCHCLPGWTGPQCETRVRPCANSPCLNNATCLDLGTTNQSESSDLFICRCKEGYHGRFCEIKSDDCTHIVCQNGGQCISKNGRSYCECLENYQGLNCEEVIVRENKLSTEAESVKSFDCSKTPCLNNGTCHNNTSLTIGSDISSVMCSCQPGFSGPYCENTVDYCTQMHCLNGGKCLLQDDADHSEGTETKYTCKCQPGFSGKQCENNIYDCFGQPCGVYGVCKDEVNGYQCECLKGWEGIFCERPTDSTKFKAYNQNTESYSMMSNNLKQYHHRQSGLCPENYCNNSATCIQMKNTSSVLNGNNALQLGQDLDITEYKCLCETAVGRFKGTNCEIDIDECVEFDQNNLSLCQNGGTCINTYGSYVCNCSKGYYGRNCEYLLDPCIYDNVSICFNGGTCLTTSDGDGILCLCPTGFTGPQCKEEINECIDKPCLSGGICLDLIGEYHCLCPTGRFGKNCELSGELVCSDHQSCGGEKDVRKNCTIQICFNGGTCIHEHFSSHNSSKNNASVIKQQNDLYGSSSPFCVCSFGYIGENCQIQLDFCQIFHNIRQIIHYFEYSKEFEDYFIEHLNISNLLFNDWLISSAFTFSRKSLTWDELNSAYSAFIINYTMPLILNASNNNNTVVLSWKESLKNHLLVDIGNTFFTPLNKNHSSALFSSISPLGLCNPEGTSNCMTLTSRNATGDANSGFTCICHLDYEGRYCEKYIDICAKINQEYNESYCLNGGWCENQIKRIPPKSDQALDVQLIPFCHCQPGYGGKRCELYHDLCTTSPCLHGGVCHPFSSPAHTDYVTSYTPPYICECSFGWSGIHCEISSGLQCGASELCLQQNHCRESLKADCPCNQTGYCGVECDTFGTDCFVATNKNKNTTVNSTGIATNFVTTSSIAATILATVTTSAIPTTSITTTISANTTETKIPTSSVNQYNTADSVNLWSGEETELSYCIENNCQIKGHNNKCDQECDLIACDFDHGDCLYALSVPLNPLPYIELIGSKTSYYMRFSHDSQINQRPEPAIPWRTCSVLIGYSEHTPCHLLFGDGNCDLQCSKEECLFDGWDCIHEKIDVNPTTDDICSAESCKDYSNDDTCQIYCNKTTVICNTTDENNCILNDDRLQSSTVPDKDVMFDNRTLVNDKRDHNDVVPGSLVLLINCTPDEILSNYTSKPSELSLLSILNEILHLEVEIKRHPDTGKLMIYAVTYLTNYTEDSDDGNVHYDTGDTQKQLRKTLFHTIQLKNENNNPLLPETYSETNIVRSRYSRDVRERLSSQKTFTMNLNDKRNYHQEGIASQVYLQLNSKKCDKTGGPCFHNVDYAAQFLTAYMHNRNHDLLQTILTVQTINPDTATLLPEEKKRNRYKIDSLSVYISSFILCILVLLFIFGVLFTVNHIQRQRSNCHLRSTNGSFNKGNLGQKTLKKVFRAKIWYPSPGSIHDQITIHNSFNNYKASELKDDKYTSSKLSGLEVYSTTFGDEINGIQTKVESVHELNKCFEILRGKAHGSTPSYLLTVDYNNSSPLRSNHITDYNDLSVSNLVDNRYTSSVGKYFMHSPTISTSCNSPNQQYTNMSSFLLSHQPQKPQHSHTPLVTFTENDNNSSTSSTVTTTVTMNGMNNFDDLECQQNENLNNYLTMQDLYQFLQAIPQAELNSFQRCLQKVILDYYDSEESANLANCETFQQQQQRAFISLSKSQNNYENTEFNSVCRLLTHIDKPSTNNNYGNPSQMILQNSMNQIAAWNMIYKSTHLYRLLNLRIPDTGETLLHISARKKRNTKVKLNSLEENNKCKKCNT
uniref:EGF-like domain-containing protein n=1 Tax=Trichobilharzia regenti TaxID=157069 RepID=A0AA85JU25_TRIRE|nr:unnamed protein product [Trichobilharzia regenti]